MNKSHSSWVWEYFEECSKESVQCKKCKKIIQRSHGSTCGMSKHLKTHLIKPPSDTEEGSKKSEDPAAKKPKLEQRTLPIFFKPSLDEILTKCIVVDGLSPNSIVKSEAICGYVRSQHYNMPKSSSSIWNSVDKFYEKEFEQLKKKLDEWTDNDSNRFLGVSIHDGTAPTQIKMIKIPTGSFKSENVVELVQGCLDSIGLDLRSDIIASTNDGAAVMKKYARLLGIIIQLCLNHAIHLGVTDVFYKKRPAIEVESATNGTVEDFRENEDDENEEDDENLETELDAAQEQSKSIFMNSNENFDIENQSLERRIQRVPVPVPVPRH